jgi:hypothetical protein
MAKMVVLRTFWGVLGNQSLADFIFARFLNFPLTAIIMEMLEMFGASG